MTTDNEPRFSERVDAMNMLEFEQLASFAAEQLKAFGFAYVDLQPGDMTSYKISIVEPVNVATLLLHERGVNVRLHQGKQYIVANSFGPLYPWDGQPLHTDYVLERFVFGNHTTMKHTAAVLARFLTTLGEKLASSPTGS